MNISSNISLAHGPDLPTNEGATSRGAGTKKRRADQTAERKDKRQRRPKYAQQACDDCRQRKVKCCGRNPCLQCTVRNTTCIYTVAQQQSRTDEVAPVRKASNKGTKPSLVSEHGPNENAYKDQIQGFKDEIAELKRQNSQLMTSLSSGVLQSPESLPEPVSEYPPNGTDTFEITNCGQGNMSLRSKLTSLHGRLSISFPLPTSPESQTPDTPGSRHNASEENPTFSLKLPGPRRLLHMLQAFFEENNRYFPCVDRTDFETRLFELIKAQGYGTTSQKLAIGPSHITFAALICIMFALVDVLDPEAPSLGRDPTKSSRKPGITWHRQAVSLFANRDLLTPLDLDVIRFYSLEAMYMIHVEQLSEASRAILMAIHSSIRGGLNDQASWRCCSAEESMRRRMLWWSVYYMDRRLAEKSGRPYYIRDSEIDVDDFAISAQEDDEIPRQNHTYKDQDGTRDRSYLQVLIQWSRLWSQTWDSFFALKAKKLGDLKEIEAMDARIVCMKNALPPAFTWDTKLFADYIQSGEDERNTRCRLISFTRINLLRLIIRHNPLMDCHEDPYTIQLCGPLAADTVKAIVTYMNKYYRVDQLGVFSTAALVECIFHLIPSLAHSAPQPHREATIEVFGAARQLLQRMSTYHNAAKHAEKMLEHIFDAVDCISQGRVLDSNQSSNLGPGWNYPISVRSRPVKTVNSKDGPSATFDAGIIMAPPNSNYNSMAESVADKLLMGYDPSWDELLNWPISDVPVDQVQWS